MQVAVPKTTSRRSRLTPEREGELYAAVIDLLREVGYEALTMDAVAARTRASKATLYRQWRGKPELVATALRSLKPVALEKIDTGSLRGDLREMVRCGEHNAERDADLLRGLAHAAHDNQDLEQALRELLIAPELTALEKLLTRAVARGEIAAGTPAMHFVPHMMTGAFVARPLIDAAHADDAFLYEYIDAVILPALGADPDVTASLTVT
ncbi:TetR/AcrR family transcriptional regulator [Streptomyces buecherae]|uniref:TetR/AcrR family transcriptional regulator n=1 Tax=Streptomyces buecherae TaxID=2763006 RepID=UPI00364D010D